jgi:hypothetical protein
MTKLRKAVFPVAGFGTRFLPAIKAMPKELLPIVDKPLIQYAAEEAIVAGIDTLKQDARAATHTHWRSDRLDEVPRCIGCMCLRLLSLGRSLTGDDGLF